MSERRDDPWRLACREGSAAFKAGQPKSANPYRDTDGYRSSFWSRGWTMAAKSSDERHNPYSLPNMRATVGVKEKRHAGHTGGKNRL